MRKRGRGARARRRGGAPGTEGSEFVAASADAGTGPTLRFGAGSVLFPRHLPFHLQAEPLGEHSGDGKVAATAHVAIGREPGLCGGDNQASIHVDCIFSAPEIEVVRASARAPFPPAE